MTIFVSLNPWFEPIGALVKPAQHSICQCILIMLGWLESCNPWLPETNHDRADVLVLALDRFDVSRDSFSKAAITRELYKRTTRELVAKHSEVVGDNRINFGFGPIFSHPISANRYRRA